MTVNEKAFLRGRIPEDGLMQSTSPLYGNWNVRTRNTAIWARVIGSLGQ
jgi:hypothetical protein